MRSLYFKVLVWSIATLLAAIAGLMLHFTFFARRGGGPGGPGFQNARLLADAAQRIYTNEGKAGLKTFLDEAADSTNSLLYVTGPDGKDLLTGDDRSALLAPPGPPPRSFPFFPPAPRSVWVATSSDNSLRWISIPRNPPPAMTPPTDALIWVLAAVALLAYLFTVYLVSPLRKLAAAVDRFGSGDLTARAGLRRNDELGHLADSFDSMAERIDTLVTSERRLLQDISHELRTPLARMRFAVEVARTDPDQKESLDRIRKECDRLAMLTDELLEICAADGDPATRKPVDSDLAALLCAVADDAGFEAAGVGVKVELRAPETLTAKIDRELLRRAFENILRNAIRYSPDGASIDIALEAKDGCALIAIRDRGPGVPAESVDKIFQPFFRVETHRARNAEAGGVGLGLAIARRAVQWHHGSIKAENAEPGLRVLVSLPL